MTVSHLSADSEDRRHGKTWTDEYSELIDKQKSAYPGAPGGVAGARCASCEQHKTVAGLRAQLIEAEAVIRYLIRKLKDENL